MRADRIADRGRALDRGDGPIARLAISADSRWLAMTRGYSNDQTRLWDLVHPQPDFAPIVLRGALLAVSGDSRSLVTAGAQGIGLVWDLTTPDPSKAAIELTGHGKGISACYYTPDGRWLITASDDRVQVWDRRSSGRPWKAARAFDGPGNRGDRLFGSPDGRWIVTGGDELQLIDLQSPTPAAASHRLPKEYTSCPRPLVSFTPDSRWLECATMSKTAQLWNLRRRRSRGEGVRAERARTRRGRASNQPGQPLARDQRRRRHRRGRSEHPAAVEPDEPGSLLLASPAARSRAGHSLMTIAPDSRWLITGSDDATLRFWDLQAENPTSTTLVIPAYSKVTSLRITPDGRFVVSTGADGLIRLWHLRLTEHSCRWRRPSAAATCRGTSGSCSFRVSPTARPSTACLNRGCRSDSLGFGLVLGLRGARTGRAAPSGSRRCAPRHSEAGGWSRRYQASGGRAIDALGSATRLRSSSSRISVPSEPRPGAARPR